MPKRRKCTREDVEAGNPQENKRLIDKERWLKRQKHGMTARQTDSQRDRQVARKEMLLQETHRKRKYR